jgi:hypothetical protein
VRLDLATALRKHPIARRLTTNFEAETLRVDLDRIPEEWWRPHLGPYHDGNWESVALWSPGGDLHEQRSRGSGFAETPALRDCPYFKSVLQAFPAPRSRVRLLRLKAGGHIHRHYDPIDSLAQDLVRLHVPVTTHDEVDFVVAGRRIRMLAGETWHVDVRFHHEVHNRGSRHRVHLVLDLHRNAMLEQLLDAAHVVGHGSLLGYCVKQALPSRLRRQLRLAN